ncbi:DsbA family protein [Escherichia coli]|uniref:DsbA family protein n=3 Tax=Escherichia coli TaxID=562 RepID=UPI000BE38478|nr:DsbA family protein [Escherichia coli]EEW1894849.1 thiol:disulfide interchange protein DsbA/DsbL [Escherichia coli]EEW2447941.1 thiol:disulfide interchange protein DsbA/DsbL [Escherichia coli]EFD7786269.1 thioredoxin domain-containing protein [Escherichia coli]EFE7851886.1 thioredoxin domain-containing protein [Escherichia coli]EFL4103857.1 thioredoxin domain-containing protein [Escherichia coli]
MKSVKIVAIIITSILLTVVFYHVFVFKNFFQPQIDNESIEMTFSDDQLTNAPIKDKKSVIKVISYGCKYCASTDEDENQLIKMLPPDVSYEVIHVAFSGPLQKMAGIFATLQVMGEEEKFRPVLYNAVINQEKDLTNDKVLNQLLEENGINVAEYHKVSEGGEVESKLKRMATISAFYNIPATPIYIIGGKHIIEKKESVTDFANLIKMLVDGK